MKLSSFQWKMIKLSAFGGKDGIFPVGSDEASRWKVMNLPRSFLVGRVEAFW